MEQIKINSKSDDLPIDVIIADCNDPQGIVQIVHGMCEYKERYLDFINYLNQNNYIVMIHDHRGHGNSVLDISDLGYFYDDGANSLVEDAYMLSQYIKTRYPNLPLYLLGHSMGSLVVRNYIQKYDQQIDGLIICGSPGLNKFAGAGKVICKVLAKVKGDKYHSKLMQKVSFGAFNKGYKKSNEWICSDIKVVEAYNNDPLCTFTFTVNGFYHLLTLMQKTYYKDSYYVNQELPILFISGCDDPCMINEKAFNHAVNVLKNDGYKQVEAILFDNMRHEILNEKNKEIVYQTIIDFIRS